MTFTSLLTVSVLLVSLTAPTAVTFQFPAGDYVPWSPAPLPPASPDAITYLLDADVQLPLDFSRNLSQGIAQMALDVDHAVNMFDGKQLVGDTNTVFSPVSIAMVLALVMLGAAGQTLAEVTRVLGLELGAGDRLDAVHEQFGAMLAAFVQREGFGTTAATGIFVQQGFPIKQRFMQVGKDSYKSDVFGLDFAGRNGNAANQINRWVEWRTQGRIKGFLTRPPSRDTKVLLASALFFKGEWEHPFPVDTSSIRSFFINGPFKNGSNSEVVQVMMMANALKLPYHSDSRLGCQIVSLPYKGKETAMHLILPNERGVEGLNNLKAKMTASALEDLISSTQVQSTIISMPRMKLESTFSLRSALETLGLRSLFDPRRSDLRELSSGVRYSSPAEEQQSEARGARENLTGGANPGLYATDALHKAEIEVTETGTVASAATAISISRDGSHRVVRMDRPFLFVIRHEKSKLILFWGAVVRPT